MVAIQICMEKLHGNRVGKFAISHSERHKNFFPGKLMYMQVSIKVSGMLKVLRNRRCG